MAGLSTFQQSSTIGIFVKFLMWHSQLLWIYHSLARLVFDEGRFDEAHTHTENAKSYAANDAYCLGRMVEQQAWFWYRQQKFEEARSAALHAASVYERLGVTKDVEDCRSLLRMIEKDGNAGLTLVNRILTVSSWNQCYILYLLTLHHSVWHPTHLLDV